MRREISEDQLVHFFAGECTAQETAEFEAWINENPDRKRRVDRLRQLWEAAEWEPGKRPDVDAIWANLARRLGDHALQSDEFERARTGLSRSDRPRLACRSRDRSVASSFAFRLSAIVAATVVFAAIVWLLSLGEMVDGKNSARTITAGIGQRAEVQLKDGSRVTLNAGSELTLPVEFGAHRREVRLQGQAYFEVAPDSMWPFLVYAGSSVTRVLGTRFEIDAYPDDETVRVVVAEGKVSVRSAREGDDQSVTLSERQMASLAEEDLPIVRREVDPAPYLAWTEGHLVFTDAPFDEVSRRLRRWYGLEIKLVYTDDAVDRLNARFSGEPVGEVLSIIGETLDLRYERDGETVRFYAREPAS